MQVTVEAVDSHGNNVPDAEGMVEIEVTGGASLSMTSMVQHSVARMQAGVVTFLVFDTTAEFVSLSVHMTPNDHTRLSVTDSLHVKSGSFSP